VIFVIAPLFVYISAACPSIRLYDLFKVKGYMTLHVMSKV